MKKIEMKRDFQKELKKIISQTKERKILIIKKDPPKSIVEEEVLWEVRKRSLNPQGLNMLIIGGLKMPWAFPFFKKHFKTKTLDNNQVIFYDLVPEKEGENLYVNPRPIIKETGENSEEDIQWQG